MPPILALILCAGFVLFLLRLDHKQAPDVTRVLWIPTIWMLIIASKPLGTWFQSSLTDPESGSPLDRAFLTIVIFAALWILIRRGFDWHSVIKENAWLVVLIVFMFVSIFWSDIPFVSFKRWVRELPAILLGFIILTEKDPRQAIQSILRRTVYILIPFSILLIKYFPEYGILYTRSGGRSWIGVALQKNSLGQLCGYAAFFLVWSLIRRWQHEDKQNVRYQAYADVFILVLTFWLQNGASSATANIMLVVGLVCNVGFLWMKKHQIKLSLSTLTAIMALVIVFGTTTLFIGRLPALDISSSLGRDSSLTGRAEIWSILLPIAMRKPILGHGVGGFWTPRTRKFYDIGVSHNGYLDVLMEFGFVGLLIVSIFMLSLCRKAQREFCHEYDWGILLICCLLMTLLNNITESTIDTLSNLLMAVPFWLALSIRTGNSSGTS